jgi:hypothetical protein
MGAPPSYGNWQANQKAGNNPSVVVGREPVSEIQDEAGEEAGLGRSQQDANDTEARRAGNHRGKARQNPQVIMIADDP